MTDFRINEDDLREPDLPDIEKLAKRLGEIARAGEMDMLIEAMGLPKFDMNDPAMFTTTVRSNEPPVTLEGLSKTFDFLKTERARIDAAETIRIVQALQDLARKHTKMKDFSFADGDWLILPAETFDSIKVPLPKGIMRSTDETSTDIFVVRGRDFMPKPGELWNHRFNKGDHR